MAKSNYYVNNADFLRILIERKALVREANVKGLPIPPVSNEIGEILLKIAKHLSYKGNFLNYSYREDMIADGLENSIRYIDNFDETKTQNPFAYFTQIMWCAFVRNIESEDKNLYIKYKSLTNTTDLTEYATSVADDGSYTNTFVDHLRENATNIIQEYEDKQERKKSKKDAKLVTKVRGLGKFVEPEDV